MTARTAAAGLMIFSGIAIVGVSVGLTGYLLANPDWLTAQWNAQLEAAGPDVREQLGAVDLSMLTPVLIACGLLGAIEGLMSIGLGWLVLRGKRWAMATSIAVTIFRVLLVAFCLLAIALSVAMGQPSGGAANLVFMLALAIVFIATWVLLVLARRRTPPPLPRRTMRPS